KQNADRNPDNPEYALMWDKLQGQLDAGAFLRGAPAEARASFDAKVNEWSNGADIHHQVYANAARQLLKDQQTEMAERPYSFAVAQGKLGSAVAPIDPAQPDAIAPALEMRSHESQRLASLDQTTPPPLLEKDERPQL